MGYVYSKDLKAGTDVVYRGFLRDRRDIGKLVFLIMSDKYGEVQAIFKKGEVSDEYFNIAKKVNRESYIELRGKVQENSKAPGGMELKPEIIKVISEAESPLPIELTEKIDTGLDKRIDWRFLDMRRKKSMNVFLFQSQIVKYLNEIMYVMGYERIFSSRITGAATEGGTEYFPIMYFNKEAFLAQSPQLYKESVLLSGMDKVFEIGFVYRAEPHHTTRHLTEYVSYDVELVSDSMDEVLDAEEEILKRLVKKLKEKEKKVLEMFGADIKMPDKIPRLSLKEANKILKERGVETEEGDLTPEGEREIGRYVLEKYNSDFVFITHFPFEKKPFYIMKSKDYEKTGLSESFDLLFKGLEITSGGQREHRYKERVKNIKDKGIDPESFDHLRFFKYGMPPHGGFAIGLERLTEKILGLGNIREASLTPRDPDRLKP